jgi:hypothetical protein
MVAAVIEGLRIYPQNMPEESRPMCLIGNHSDDVDKDGLGVFVHFEGCSSVHGDGSVCLICCLSYLDHCVETSKLRKNAEGFYSAPW